MKKKLLYGCFLAVFLLICLVPGLGLALQGPGQALANEQLTPAPGLTTPEGGVNWEYPQQLTDFVNDNFYLRRELITLDRLMNARLLATGAQQQVLLGREGWLYFADTLPDYTGTEPMTQRQLYCAAHNLALLQQHCQEQGSGFAFAIAPNKNALYPQYMPQTGAVAQTTNASRLMALLEQQGVTTVDLHRAFREQPQSLYFAHDSHWNSQGAALGADRINEAFGVESHYFSDPFSNRVSHSGDLYEMMYPALTDPETDPVYGGELRFAVTSRSTQPDAILLTTESDKPGSLLVYRDSFGNLLYPYLADSYGSVRFSRSTTYDLTQPYDYVLIQLVERNLSNLYTNAPKMPAPLVQLTLPQASGQPVALSTQASGQLVLCSGQLPQAPDPTSPVYLVTDQGVYEAFCLDSGFAAYLPQGSSCTGLAYSAGGQLQHHTINQN